MKVSTLLLDEIYYYTGRKKIHSDDESNEVMKA